MLGAIALAAISTFGTVKNEIETGHTMLGKIVTADPAHYEGGASAINVHLLGYWRWNENVKLYAGVRHISVVQDEIRRQYDAWDSPNAKSDFTYFVVGVYLTV